MFAMVKKIEDATESNNPDPYAKTLKKRRAIQNYDLLPIAVVLFHDNVRPLNIKALLEELRF